MLKCRLQLTYDVLEFKLLLVQLFELLPVFLDALLISIVLLVPEKLLEIALADAAVVLAGGSNRH